MLSFWASKPAAPVESVAPRKSPPPEQFQSPHSPAPAQSSAPASPASHEQFQQYISAITATHDEIKTTAMDKSSALNGLIDQIIGPEGSSMTTGSASPISVIDIEKFRRAAGRFESLLVALSDLLQEVTAEAAGIPADVLASDPHVRRAVVQFEGLRDECLRTVVATKDVFRPRLLRAHKRCADVEKGRISGDAAGDIASTTRRGSAPPAKRGKAAAAAAASSLTTSSAADTRPREPAKFATIVTVPSHRRDGAADDDADAASPLEGERLALLQQHRRTNRCQLTLSNGQVLNGVTVTDELLAEEAALEMERLALETQRIKEMMATINANLAEQQEKLAAAESNADNSLTSAAGGRMQLSAASRLGLLGATVTGAIVGGLVAGPVGMVAGAKSASTVVGCVAGGMFVGGAVTSGVAKATAKRNATVDDRYADELEQRSGGKR